MRNRRFCLLLLLVAITGSASAAGAVRVLNGGPVHSLEEATLFPFDDRSIPLVFRLRTNHVNAEGLSESSDLKVELLDEKFQGVEGFSREETATVRESGFRQPVHWQGEQSVADVDQPIRIRVSYHGIRLEDLQFYALYVRAGSGPPVNKSNRKEN